MSENRREARYPARIVARVVRRGESLELLTNDVSFRGAFLRTDSPPALRQLVRVAFSLPNGKTIDAHAMVVHVHPPDGGGVPGVGLQFWGMMAEKSTWERFVYELRSREKAGAASARATDRVRRNSERFRLQVTVQLDGAQVMTRDVSTNGMAVRTEMPMPIGTRASLELRSGDESLTIDIMVRRRIDEPDFRGLGVEYVDVVPDAREAIAALVRAHMPTESMEIVAADDPDLH